MEYLVVLPVPGSSMRDYAELIGIEEHVSQALGDIGVVDGLAVGNSETSIVVLTNKPQETLALLRRLPDIPEAMPELRASYRQIGDEDVEVVGPDGTYRFHIA